MTDWCVGFVLWTQTKVLAVPNLAQKMALEIVQGSQAVVETAKSLQVGEAQIKDCLQT